jgi:hypothetical protein
MKVYVIRIDKQQIDEQNDAYFSHAWAGIFDSEEKASEGREELIAKHIKENNEDNKAVGNDPLSEEYLKHLDEGVELIEYELNEILIEDF